MIKFVTIAIALAITGIAFATDVKEIIRLSEPVEQTENSETFGTSLDESIPAVTLGQISSDGDNYVGKSVQVVARVAQVC